MAGSEAERARMSAESVPPELRLIDFRRAGACQVQGGTALDRDLSTPLNGDCANGTDEPPACEDGAALEPLWRRSRDTTDSPWSPWKLAADYSCPEELFALTMTDFRRLPLAKPALTVQPDRGWVLVNKETIVYTDDVTQELTTEVLGQKIDVEADAQSWTWNWGDKTTDLTTTEAGKPYPHQTLWHTYQQLGTVHVTLTATWKGRWRLHGHTTWHDVLGTAQTTATSDPFEIRELRSRLVAPEDD
ncbi:PKD domain-containing protein [Cellulomonas sp. HZM]|uniref:PKD domain-containing protein n=1 Tax=Cellulomonas sp. HZM TaxID=1454010 RepID=UPI00068F61F2|nr:PKD domain-containing protein [Cellulomonas sp. HZM]